MIATSVVGGGQEEQHCQAAAKLRPRLSRIHRLLRKGNYASRVGAGAAVMSGMVSFSIFFTLQQYVGTWFPSFQGQPLISGAMPLESGAGFA